MAILRGSGKGTGPVMEACPPDNASSIGKMPEKGNIKDADMVIKAPYGGPKSK